ncbi:MAG: hypothetical protein U9Q73_02540 [Nanoarchaeota archaeon]|nr:hypothetical protein [Nanoarchaeota archaeon]
MEKEEIIYLEELLRIFESTFNQMKQAYIEKDPDKFNSMKKALANVQEKISRATK